MLAGLNLTTGQSVATTYHSKFIFFMENVCPLFKEHVTLQNKLFISVGYRPRANQDTLVKYGSTLTTNLHFHKNDYRGEG